MSRQVKVTEFKTKRINRLTGGKIGNFQVPDCPGEDGNLINSFLTMDGAYIDNYDRAWWYVKHNLKVCNDYPHGVAECYEGTIFIGYHGYTHRGGQTFKIWDKIFDENYIPKKKDYTDSEWARFKFDRVKSANNEVKNGYAETFDEALESMPISDFVPFVKRGNKLIETMEDAKRAAINMSKYLS